MDDQMLRLAAALTDLDRYREMADKLAGAIADLLDIEIGEHSSDNDPWQKALDAAQVAGFVVEQANARAKATMQMANEANAKLRALLLAALRIDDDGRTSLTGYVEALIADRDAVAEQADALRALADRMERRAADGGDNPADCNAMAEFADELRRIAEGGDRG